MYTYPRSSHIRKLSSFFSLLCTLSAIISYSASVHAQSTSPEFSFAARQYILSERIPRQTVTVTRSGAIERDVSVGYSVSNNSLVATGCT